MYSAFSECNFASFNTYIKITKSLPHTKDDCTFAIFFFCSVSCKMSVSQTICLHVNFDRKKTLHQNFRHRNMTRALFT